MEKKIVVLGGLGKSARRDRCVDRIVFRGGLSIAICSHSSVDKPMVIKKWKSEQSLSEK